MYGSFIPNALKIQKVANTGDNACKTYYYAPTPKLIKAFMH